MKRRRKKSVKAAGEFCPASLVTVAKWYFGVLCTFWRGDIKCAVISSWNKHYFFHFKTSSLSVRLEKVISISKVTPGIYMYTLDFLMICLGFCIPINVICSDFKSIFFLFFYFTTNPSQYQVYMWCSIRYIFNMLHKFWFTSYDLHKITQVFR